MDIVVALLHLWQPKTLTAKVTWKNITWIDTFHNSLTQTVLLSSYIPWLMYYIERHDQLYHPKTLQHTKVAKTNQVWPGKRIYLFSLQRISSPTSSWSRNCTFTTELCFKARFLCGHSVFPTELSVVREEVYTRC